MSMKLYLFLIWNRSIISLFGKIFDENKSIEWLNIIELIAEIIQSYELSWLCNFATINTGGFVEWERREIELLHAVARLINSVICVRQERN